ncbi:hypothetical protein Tco_1360874 [Tanacetum coccineum]
MGEADINTLTMKQYLALTRGNQAPGVVKPEIGGNVNFEIKCKFMRELKEDTFYGNKNDDAYEYMERILDIVSLFNIPGVIHDAVMLRVFPITLTGATKRWVNRLSLGTINTWDLLKNAFIQREVKEQHTETKKGECKEIFTKVGLPLYTPFYYSPEEIEYFFADSSLSEEVVQEEMEKAEEINDETAQCEPTDQLLMPIDFVILDMVEDFIIPIILGRPLFAIAHAKVDIFRKSVSLEVGNQKVIFKTKDDPNKTLFETVCAIRNEKSLMNDDLMKIDHDLFLYDSKSCIATNEFNYLLVTDPHIFSYEVYEQESQNEVDHKCRKLDQGKLWENEAKEEPNKECELDLSSFAKLKEHWCKAILQKKGMSTNFSH